MEHGLYIYFFYRLSKLAKNMMPKSTDFIESGCALLSVCLVFNGLMVLFFISHYISLNLSSSYFLIGAIAISIWLINRRFLLTKEREEKIFSFYEKLHYQNIFGDILLILYVIFSFAIPLFFASLHRSGKW